MVRVGDLVEFLVYVGLTSFGVCLGMLLSAILLFAGVSPWLVWIPAPIGGAIGMIVARRILK